jgi:DNA-binding NarL/FixJ family response regulator
MTGADALAIAERGRVAAVLLDVWLPDVSGYEVCRALRELLGWQTPIVFISAERREPYDRVAGLLLGADDYVVAPYLPEELVARVRGLLRRTRGLHTDLTSRELEVLAHLAEGRNQGEIARLLAISPKTVGTHIERILRKLDAHSRAEAVAIAYRERLVPDLGASLTLSSR